MYNEARVRYSRHGCVCARAFLLFAAEDKEANHDRPDAWAGARDSLLMFDLFGSKSLGKTLLCLSLSYSTLL